MSEENKQLISFTLKDGTVVSYESDFKLEDGFLKKFRLFRGRDSEGPWFWIHPDDVKDYEADVNDSKVRLGVTANATLNGIPWGAIFPYQLKGSDRPECDMEKLIDLTGEVVFHPELKKKIDAAKAKEANTQ